MTGIQLTTTSTSQVIIHRDQKTSLVDKNVEREKREKKAERNSPPLVFLLRTHSETPWAKYCQKFTQCGIKDDRPLDSTLVASNKKA